MAFELRIVCLFSVWVKYLKVRKFVEQEHFFKIKCYCWFARGVNANVRLKEYAIAYKQSQKITI